MVAFLVAAGGIALLVFGVRFLGKGLDRLWGERLAVWMGRLGGGRIRMTLAGMGIGSVFQSTTTLSMVAVSMVETKRLDTRGAVSLLLGAFTGASVAVAVVALDLHGAAPILALIGVPLYIRRWSNAARGVGQVLIGLSVVFMAVGVIRSQTALLLEPGAPSSQAFAALLELGRTQPWLLLLLGAMLAVLFQSSTATAALAMGLAFGGVTDLWVLVVLVAGSNIGTSVTTLVVGWGGLASRRAAGAALVLRAGVGVGVLGLVEMQPEAVPVLSLPMTIAVAHAGFNLAAVLAGLVLMDPVLWVVRAIVPERADRDGSAVRLNGVWAEDPALAFVHTKHEIAQVSKEISRMLDDFWQAMRREDDELCSEVRRRDDTVDRSQKAIRHYLTQQVSEELSDPEAASLVAQLRFLSDLEVIGDVISINLVNVARKKIRRGVRFSEDGWRELDGFFRLVRENVHLATAAFLTNDRDLARKLLELKRDVRDETLDLGMRHFQRLRSGHPASLETTELHMETLAHLKHINHLCAAVAYSVLGADPAGGSGTEGPDEGPGGLPTVPKAPLEPAEPAPAGV